MDGDNIYPPRGRNNTSLFAEGDGGREGFAESNYTQTPNSFFNEVLPLITSLAELKVTLAVIRKTFGWHVADAELSLSALRELTGLSRESVIEGVKKGMKRGTVGRRARGGGGFSYFLAASPTS